MDIATLVFRIDSSQVRGATKDLDNMAAAGKRADVTFGQMGKGVGDLRNVIATLGIATLFNDTIRAADAYTKLSAQLRIATNGTQEFKEAYESVIRISNAAQASVESTATLYARLSNSLKDAGESQKGISDITETISLALKVNGATAQETASAMLQLSQAFGSGVINGEEFKTAMEAAPNLMRALAESIGVPVGALKGLASEGKITGEVLAKAFKDQNLLDSLRAQSKEMYTISGSFQVMQNNLTLLVGDLDKATQGSYNFAKSISWVSEQINDLRTGEASWFTQFLAGIPGLMISSFADESQAQQKSAGKIRRRPSPSAPGLSSSVGNPTKLRGTSAASMFEENTAAMSLANAYEELYTASLALTDAGKPLVDKFQDQLDSISRIDEATRQYYQTIINTVKAEEQWQEMARLQIESESHALADLELQSSSTADEVERFKQRSYKAWMDLLPAAERLQLEIDELYMTAQRLGLDKSWADNIAEQMKQSTKAAEDAGTEMTKFMKRAAENMQDAMADGFFDLMQGNFDDLESTFKRTIDRMVAELLASQLNNELFGPQFSKTGVLGGMVGGLAKGAEDFFGDIFGGLFADGGTPPLGKVSIVGEKGPELFVPKSAGTIVPNSQINQGVTINGPLMVVHAKDAGSFNRSESQIAAQMQRALNKGRRVV